MGGRTGAAAGAWGDDYWTSESTFASRRRVPSSRPDKGFHRAVDPRGAFVAVFCLLILLACVLPYYRAVGPGGVVAVGGPTLRVASAAFGSWRAVLPAIAVVTAAFGVADSVLRVGSRGAVGVLAALRLLALAQLGLWILVAFFHPVPVASRAAVGAEVTVTWVAWAAIAAAAIALAGSFASMSRQGSG